ncbi:PLP-dependent aminotransferase family protein [Microlunatus sp. GCM10028923]|uniref:MocR-like pyridoxine biosynthesis transcription factor PdxR n=1 Tax=Microlunatus sp. GCM10028923 TaxID=3273400 RepID=UPI0036200681
MTRRNLHINLVGRRNLGQQIYRYVRQAILDGLLEPADVLPSTRQLAAQLEVSRTTVGTAYDRLMAEGLVRGRAGVGTVVSPGRSMKMRMVTRSSPLKPARLWTTGLPTQQADAADAAYNLRPGIPDPHLFPFATWRSLVARHTNQKTLPGRPADPAGQLRLREALVQHLGLARGIRTEPPDVFVTDSARQALELVARVLLEPGDAVAVEEPGDRTVKLLFASLGIRTIPIPIDDEGVVVEAIPPGVRAAYVRAARQLPLGMALSIDRRHALLDWAVAADGVIIEDDCGGQLQYAPRPPSPLYALDDNARTIHLGSLRCLMLSGLGVGYLVAPAPLHGALRRAKQISEPYQSTVLQLAVAAFIDEGHLARQLRRVRSIYAERRQLLDDASRRLDRYARRSSSTTGLDLTMVFTDHHVDDVKISRRALQLGVELVALSELATSDQLSGLLLGYGALPAENIDDAVERLQRAVESVVPAEELHKNRSIHAGQWTRPGGPDY